MLMQQQQDAQNVLQFKHGNVEKMCVTSYETIRKHSASLVGTFDLMVCDEGHRQVCQLARGGCVVSWKHAMPFLCVGICATKGTGKCVSLVEVAS